MPQAAPEQPSPPPGRAIFAIYPHTFDEKRLAIPLPGMIVDMIGKGYSQSALTDAMGALFDRHTDNRIQPYGDLSAETLEAHLKSSVARRRAALMAEVLDADTDWDGTVTRAELEASQRHRDAEDLLARFDDDHDDAITSAELRVGAGRLVDAVSTRALLTRMLAWDQNGDGRVSRGEALSLVFARFIQPPPYPR